ncbi:MAG: Uma2 family endonuclease, partial [Phormidium sp. SL48-SHIP]
NLLRHGEERAEQEHQRAERLAARLRELGIDPDEEAVNT